MRFFSIIITLLLGCSYTTRAQNDWVEHTQEQGIVFSAKDASCDVGGGLTIDYKLLKITNTTAQKVRVSYRIATYYANQAETGENSPENGGEVELNPGQSISGGCANTLPARLEVLVRNPNIGNSPLFTHFSIKAITIDRIE